MISKIEYLNTFFRRPGYEDSGKFHKQCHGILMGSAAAFTSGRRRAFSFFQIEFYPVSPLRLCMEPNFGSPVQKIEERKQKKREPSLYVIGFYGEKLAYYLFGHKFSAAMRLVYVAGCFIEAVGGLKFMWIFLGLFLGLVVIINMAGVMGLSSKVVKTTKEFFC